MIFLQKFRQRVNCCVFWEAADMAKLIYLADDEENIRLLMKHLRKTLRASRRTVVLETGWRLTERIENRENGHGKGENG